MYQRSAPPKLPTPFGQACQNGLAVDLRASWPPGKAEAATKQDTKFHKGQFSKRAKAAAAVSLPARARHSPATHQLDSSVSCCME